MPHGYLNDEMEEAIAKLIQGKTVWDLGAGDYGHARRLVELGASKVIAIDKEISKDCGPLNIEPRMCYFKDVEVPSEGIDVAWVSWPCNYPLLGLKRLLEGSKLVIYLGLNTDGNACGPKDIWEHLACREIVSHVPNRRNSLIAYGGALKKPRQLLGEEFAVLDGRMMSFKEAAERAQAAWVTPLSR